ncbi:MAG TPA: exopolysaccharide biosynthesis protein [Chthoniobacteraceae bacterium]|jgi:hypothetical protein|nr:exopolysaccharide biosynthesis protein [Chthoniobacteraceae bacterium]
MVPTSDERIVAPDAVGIPAKRPPRLSEEIDSLLVIIAGRPLRLREMLSVLQGRAYMFLLILLSLPFCTPIPIPGLSTLFGGIIALIGLRLSLRMKPWLPARILDAELSPKLVSQLLHAAKKTAKWIEVLLKPRLSFLVDFLLLHHLYGAMICISGLLLMLPLPIPLSNFLPAITVVFLAAALLERDGYFVIAGVLAFVVDAAFFSAIFLGGAAVVNWLEDWFGETLDPNHEQPPEVLEEITTQE